MHNDFFRFFLLPIALIGIHLTEPYLRFVLDKQTNYATLLDVFPKLYNDLLTPINLCQITNAPIKSLEEKFSVDVYPKEWMEAIQEELNETDLDLTNSVCQKMLDKCAAAFARQRGSAFQFGSSKTHQFPIREQIPEHMLETAPTHNISSEKVFGDVDNRLKHSGPYGFGGVSEKLVITHSSDLVFNDCQWREKNLKIMKKETDKLKIKWNSSQKEIRLNSRNTTHIDTEKIVHSRKLLSMKEQLRLNYGIIPTNYEGIEIIMKKVSNESEKGKVLRTLAKIAKGDFKNLKDSHLLFKQRGLNQKSILNNLKILYGEKCRNITATIDDIRAVICASGTDSESAEFLDDLLTLKDVPENEIVAALWDEEWCVGQVISKIDKDTCTYRIKYMKRVRSDSNVYWIWPVQDDIHKTKQEQILIIRPIIEVSDISSTRTIIFELYNHALINNIAEDM